MQRKLGYVLPLLRLVSELSRAEGPLGELHAYLYNSRTRMTSRNMRVGRFVFKTVVSSYRSDNTHLKYTKWKEKALKNTQKPVWWKKKSFKR